MSDRPSLLALVALQLLACTGSSAPEIPGLEPAEEVALVEVEPAPSDEL